MKSSKSIYIGITLVVVASALALLFLRGVSEEPNTTTTAGETIGFKPPVYETGDSPDVLTSPLFLTANEKETASLTPEAEQMIAAFKHKVLARIASKKPLSDEEKGVLRISISTSEKSSIGEVVLADQNTLHFAPVEIALIESALTR